MSIQFAETEIPAVQRAENPYSKTIAGLKGTEKALISDALPNKTDEDKKVVNALVRKLREAGRDNDVTVRTVLVEGGSKAAPTVQVKFWTVARIARPRKSETETEQTTAETAEQTATA